MLNLLKNTSQKDDFFYNSLAYLGFNQAKHLGLAELKFLFYRARGNFYEQLFFFDVEAGRSIGDCFSYQLWPRGNQQLFLVGIL